MTRRQKIAFAAGALGAVVGASLWWRQAARRRALPCPAWAAGVLDHPFSGWVPPSLDKLELSRGMRVLDVGCGPGRLSIAIAQQIGPEGEAVALDIQPGMLRRLRTRIARSPVANIRPVLGDITRSPFREGSFDRAVLVTVLGEIPDRLAAMRGIFSALKPGGMLSITEIFGDPHYQWRGTVRRLAEAAGFQVHREHRGMVSFTMNLQKPRT